MFSPYIVAVSVATPPAIHIFALWILIERSVSDYVCVLVWLHEHSLVLQAVRLETFPFRTLGYLGKTLETILNEMR